MSDNTRITFPNSPYSPAFCARQSAARTGWVRCCSSLQTTGGSERWMLSQFQWRGKKEQQRVTELHTKTQTLASGDSASSDTMVRESAVEKGLQHQPYVQTSRAAGREATKETAKLCLLCCLILACRALTAKYYSGLLAE